MCVNILYVGKMGQTVSKTFNKTYARWGNRTFINIKYRQKPLQISPSPFPHTSPFNPVMIFRESGPNRTWLRSSRPGNRQRRKSTNQSTLQPIRVRSHQSEHVPANQSTLQPIGVRSHQSEHVPANPSKLQPIGVRSHQSEHVPANQSKSQLIRVRSYQ